MFLLWYGLRQLITAYDASGLPPAYVPKDVT